MKTFKYIVMSIFGLGLISVLAFYLFLIRPGQKFVQKNKQHFLNQSTNFVRCITEQDARECQQRLMTEEAKKVVSVETLQLLGTKVKNNLGKRLKAVPIDESFIWRKYAGQGGMNFIITFAVSAAYEKDPRALEQWTLIRQGDGPFLVQLFKINSNEMLK